MKKYLVIMAMAISTLANAQCEEIIEHQVDKMDDSEMWFMKNPVQIGESKTGIFSNLVMGSQNKTIIWINTAEGVGCVDEGSRVDILFTDGTKLQLSSNGKFNCLEKSTIYFHRAYTNDKHLKTFCEKKIGTLRVWSRTTNNQQDLTEEQADMIMAAFNCMKQIRDK